MPNSQKNDLDKNQTMIEPTPEWTRVSSIDALSYVQKQGDTDHSLSDLALYTTDSHIPEFKALYNDLKQGNLTDEARAKHIDTISNVLNTFIKIKGIKDVIKGKIDNKDIKIEDIAKLDNAYVESKILFPVLQALTDKQTSQQILDVIEKGREEYTEFWYSQSSKDFERDGIFINKNGETTFIRTINKELPNLEEFDLTGAQQEYIKLSLNQGKFNAASTHNDLCHHHIDGDRMTYLIKQDEHRAAGDPRIPNLVTIDGSNVNIYSKSKANIRDTGTGNIIGSHSLATLKVDISSLTGDKYKPGLCEKPLNVEFSYSVKDQNLPISLPADGLKVDHPLIGDQLYNNLPAFVKNIDVTTKSGNTLEIKVPVSATSNSLYDVILEPTRNLEERLTAFDALDEQSKQEAGQLIKAVVVSLTENFCQQNLNQNAGDKRAQSFIQEVEEITKPFENNTNKEYLPKDLQEPKSIHNLVTTLIETNNALARHSQERARPSRDDGNSPKLLPKPSFRERLRSSLSNLSKFTGRGE